jgi:rhodanese-related sulfurtransferase
MTNSTVRTIAVDDLRTQLDRPQAPRILDVRTPAEYETAHIPGSYNVPLTTLAEHRTELARHVGEDIVLVCRSGNRATQAETALAGVGRTDLRVLDGGMVAWEQASGPLNRGRRTWDLERQVRFVAGSIVAASVIGSHFAPRLKWLAAGLGTGLVTAAVTNSCAMGAALSRMPWNRPTGTPDIGEVLTALAA